MCSPQHFIPLTASSLAQNPAVRSHCDGLEPAIDVLFYTMVVNSKCYKLLQSYSINGTTTSYTNPGRMANVQYSTRLAAHITHKTTSKYYNYNVLLRDYTSQMMLLVIPHFTSLFFNKFTSLLTLSIQFFVI